MWWSISFFYLKLWTINPYFRVVLYCIVHKYNEVKATQCAWGYVHVHQALASDRPPVRDGRSPVSRRETRVGSTHSRGPKTCYDRSSSTRPDSSHLYLFLKFKTGHLTFNRFLRKRPFYKLLLKPDVTIKYNKLLVSIYVRVIQWHLPKTVEADTEIICRY